jgi:predicted ester cyclase
MQCKILEQIADGDKVVCLWTAQATHKGTFMGVAPTNKRVTVTGISIFLIVNGKIVEGRTNWDLMGLLTQLGVLPTLLKKVA